jgi:hypothetical protein
MTAARRSSMTRSVGHKTEIPRVPNTILLSQRPRNGDETNNCFGEAGTHTTASRPAPKYIYEPGQGLNDNSVWSKFRYRRNLGCDKAVIWRTSVDRECEHVREDFSFGRF